VTDEVVVATVGYEGKRVDDLLGILHREDVEVLVDVRLNAMSRKPGYSKRRLTEALAVAGIDYVHEPRLGNPKENRPGFAAGTAESRDIYLRRLTGESRAAFEDIVRLSHERAIALMCFESDHRSCHRTCIVEQMRAEDPALRVVDL
jgi:uncharacterized protein (DUF488 family)